MFHDVGMARMAPDVLQRWNHTQDESDPDWRAHVHVGFDVVKNALGPAAAAAVLHHHQKFDGTGFPRRLRLDGTEEPLAGSDIHVFARIVAAADLFDRLRHPPAALPGSTPTPVVRVLKRLQQQPYANWIDPMVFRGLLSVVPPSVPGSIVTLSTGQQAVVTEWFPEDPCRPAVHILPNGLDALGPDDPIERIDLRQRTGIVVARAEGHDVTSDNFFPEHPALRRRGRRSLAPPDRRGVGTAAAREVRHVEPVHLDVARRHEVKQHRRLPVARSEGRLEPGHGRRGRVVDPTVPHPPGKERSGERRVALARVAHDLQVLIAEGHVRAVGVQQARPGAGVALQVHVEAVDLTHRQRQTTHLHPAGLVGPCGSHRSVAPQQNPRRRIALVALRRPEAVVHRDRVVASRVVQVDIEARDRDRLAGDHVERVTREAVVRVERRLEVAHGCRGLVADLPVPDPVRERQPGERRVALSNEGREPQRRVAERCRAVGVPQRGSCCGVVRQVPVHAAGLVGVELKP
ncbi:HD domain-containing protein [Leptolyngbya sp. 15MV]|nr:HD domain-containing protein [Leptolyngbya sp. 15MV]